MDYAVFKKNHIALAGNRYLVANAEVLPIGSIGEQETPLFGQNKLEPKDHVPPAKLDGQFRLCRRSASTPQRPRRTTLWPRCLQRWPSSA